MEGYIRIYPVYLTSLARPTETINDSALHDQADFVYGLWMPVIA